MGYPVEIITEETFYAQHPEIKAQKAKETGRKLPPKRLPVPLTQKQMRETARMFDRP
jgi:hypothetical protein